MKKILALLVILSLFESCVTLDRQVGNGIEQDKTIELSKFNGISYDLSDDLIIKQGDNNAVKLIGDSNILDNVELKIENGVLFVDLLPGSYYNINVRAEITLKTLKWVENTGSGNVFIESRRDNNDNLKLISDGSGNIHVFPQHDLKEISVRVDGSGDLTFDGETSVSRVNIKTDGSGNMNAYSLSTEHCDVFTDGSGDLRLTVMEELVGTIEGNGNIYYKGSPQVQMIYEDSGELINVK